MIHKITYCHGCWMLKYQTFNNMSTYVSQFSVIEIEVNWSLTSIEQKVVFMYEKYLILKKKFHAHRFYINQCTQKNRVRTMKDRRNFKILTLLLCSSKEIQSGEIENYIGPFEYSCSGFPPYNWNFKNLSFVLFPIFIHTQTLTI